MLDALRRLLPGPLGRRAADWPSALAGYATARAGFDRRRTLEAVRFVVFDTETTGLDPRRDRVLSIAGVALHGDRIVVGDSFEATVAQAGVGGAAAAAVHGLVRRDLAGGLAEGEAVVAFLDWVRDAVLVGQHVAFDVAVVDAALGRLVPAGATAPRVWNPTVDTEGLAKRVDGSALGTSAAHGGSDGGRRSLDDLLASHGLDTVDRHTAAGDALATAELFQRLLRGARRRGIDSLRSLLRTPAR